MRSLLVCSVSLACLVACADDDPAGGPDAAPVVRDAAPVAGDGAVVDAGLDASMSPADAALDGDGSGDAAQPAGDAGMVVPSPDLVGTRFERVGLSWDAPIELCTAFRDRDLVEARASRLHLTLAPAPRVGLGRAQLASATLVEGLVRRSPLAADQRALGVVTSTLTDWTLSDPSGRAQLVVRLVHRLAGAEIVEEISAVRDGTHQDAVDVDSGVEVHFTFVDTSTPGAPRTIPLERCGVGSPSRVDTLEVLVAENAGGQTMAVLRHARTNLVAAGSAPVTLLRGQVSLPDEPWIGWSAQGFWAWTYAASLHNWNEHSTLDFTLDAALHHSVFVPDAPVTVLARPVARVDLEGVNGPGVSGSVTVARRALSTGAEDRSTWTALTQWRDVSASALVPSCTGGRTETLGLGDNVVFQAVRCPDDSIEALMPVLFAWDQRRDGERLEARDFTAVQIMGRSGVRAEIGAAAIEVATWDASTYIVRLFDDAGMDVYNGLVSADSGLPAVRADELLSRRSADGAVVLRIARRYAWQGVGESSIFAPIRLELEHAGQRYAVEAYDRLLYTNTHHNWRDTLVARTDNHQITWTVEFDVVNGGLIEHVEVVRSADGAVVVPDTIVAPQ